MNLVENKLNGKCDVTVVQVYEYLKKDNKYTIEQVSAAMEDMVIQFINPGLQIAYNIASGASYKLEIPSKPDIKSQDEDEILKIYNEIKSIKIPDKIESGDTLIVKNSPYTVHAAPSGKSPVIGTLPIGFCFWIKEMKSGWGLTSYGGYVYPKENDFLKLYPHLYDSEPIESPYNIGTKYVCKKDINVYMGASEVFNVLTTLKAGSIIEFTDISREKTSCRKLYFPPIVATITSTKGVNGYIILKSILNANEMFEKYVEPISPLKTTVDGSAEKEVVAVEKKDKAMTNIETESSGLSDTCKKLAVITAKYIITAGRFRDTWCLENHINKLNKAGLHAIGLEVGPTTVCVIGYTDDKEEADEIVKVAKKKGFVVRLVEN